MPRGADHEQRRAELLGRSWSAREVFRAGDGPASARMPSDRETALEVVERDVRLLHEAGLDVAGSARICRPPRSAKTAATIGRRAGEAGRGRGEATVASSRHLGRSRRGWAWECWAPLDADGVSGRAHRAGGGRQEGADDPHDREDDPEDEEHDVPPAQGRHAQGDERHEVHQANRIQTNVDSVIPWVGARRPRRTPGAQRLPRPGSSSPRAGDWPHPASHSGGSVPPRGIFALPAQPLKTPTLGPRRSGGSEEAAPLAGTQQRQGHRDDGPGAATVGVLSAPSTRLAMIGPAVRRRRRVSADPCATSPGCWRSRPATTRSRWAVRRCCSRVLRARSGRPRAWRSRCCTSAVCAGGPASCSAISARWSATCCRSTRGAAGDRARPAGGDMAGLLVAVDHPAAAGRPAGRDGPARAGRRRAGRRRRGAAISATVAMLAVWAGGLIAASEMACSGGAGGWATSRAGWSSSRSRWRGRGRPRRRGGAAARGGRAHDRRRGRVECDRGLGRAAVDLSGVPGVDLGRAALRPAGSDAGGRRRGRDRGLGGVERARAVRGALADRQRAQSPALHRGRGADDAVPGGDRQRAPTRRRSELAESHARIATAAADERRRLEGELHDSAQNRLVALRSGSAWPRSGRSTTVARGRRRAAGLLREAEGVGDELRRIAQRRLAAAAGHAGTRRPR